MANFHAQPYAMDGVTGFYFDAGEFSDKQDEYNEARRAAGLSEPEEWAIQFIDGEDWEAKVCEAAKLTQGNIDDVCELLEYLDDEDDDAAKAAAWYALDNGYGAPDDVLQKVRREGYRATPVSDRIYSEEDALADYAQDITEQCGDVPEHLKGYIDWRAMGRDMHLNGEVDAFSFDGSYFVISPTE